jgi:glutamate racemase
MLNKNFKIGIFDSGIGGLTVAKAINDLCPEVSLLYVGDTAHMPWGDKSTAHIISYAIKITEFLIQNNCNIIVIACYTASANALAAISDKFSQIKLFNVIDPIILFLKQEPPKNNIGLIGTKQTIRSGTFQNQLSQVIAIATPILAPLIEEGLINNAATDLILEQYLTKLDLADQSVLLLGCTHYGLIKPNIENYYAKINKNIKVIDGAMLVAKQIKNFLKNNFNLSNLKPNLELNSKVNKFYVTDDSEFFLRSAKQFFADINLDFLPLWE